MVSRGCKITQLWNVEYVYQARFSTLHAYHCEEITSLYSFLTDKDVVVYIKKYRIDQPWYS